VSATTQRGRSVNRTMALTAQRPPSRNKHVGLYARNSQTVSADAVIMLPAHGGGGTREMRLGAGVSPPLVRSRPTTT